VVVADAGSMDETRRLAERRGATVVDGGKPAAGRNAGAQAAIGDLILFLDADDEIDEDFIATVLDEFVARELSVATTFVDPIERDPRNIFACEVVNLYLDVMQYVAPHAPGFCILVRRDVHEAIGGFDETVILAEDHDYVQRAAEQGKFRVLSNIRVGTSMRRIEKEGLVRLAFKYLYCELYVVTGTPIREVPFDYEFAAFEPAERPEAAAAIESLRERLDGFANAALGASADGLQGLLQLATRESSPSSFDRALRDLGEGDVRRLRRYVGARFRLARRLPRRVARLATDVVRSIGEAGRDDTG
jgi:glycosyltransferase involved in cell wall biosynthesis